MTEKKSKKDEFGKNPQSKIFLRNNGHKTPLDREKQEDPLSLSSTKCPLKTNFYPQLNLMKSHSSNIRF